MDTVHDSWSDGLARRHTPIPVTLLAALVYVYTARLAPMALSSLGLALAIWHKPKQLPSSHAAVPTGQSLRRQGNTGSSQPEQPWSKASLSAVDLTLFGVDMAAVVTDLQAHRMAAMTLERRAIGRLPSNASVQCSKWSFPLMWRLAMGDTPRE